MQLLLSAMGARPMTASDCRDGGSGGTSLCPARPGGGVAAAATVQPLVQYSVMAEAVGCRLSGSSGCACSRLSVVTRGVVRRIDTPSRALKKRASLS